MRPRSLPYSMVGPLAQLLGHPLRVLDDGAIHVDDIQCAVRPDFQIDRAEPFIARGQEFDALVRRRRVNVTPFGCMISRCTRWPVGSQTKMLP